eukprot:5564592-Amphidinium_carterae.1
MSQACACEPSRERSSDHESFPHREHLSSQRAHTTEPKRATVCAESHPGLDTASRTLVALLETHSIE